MTTQARLAAPRGLTVIHAMPSGGASVTPCCGLVPRDLPPLQAVTPDLTKVTCRGWFASPLPELVAMVLSQAKATGATEAPRLPHGGDGHAWDPRCAACTGDVHAMALAITTALTEASTARPVYAPTLEHQGSTPR